MADLNQFGGQEEENAEIKRLNIEVVCFPRAISTHIGACPRFVLYPLGLEFNRV